MRASAIVLFTVGMAATVSAQWLTHPTPGVPRLPNGAVNLNASAPRAGAQPDFSGLWTGATTLADPACAGTAGCIAQEPLPVQAVHIAQTSPDQFQRVRVTGAARVTERIRRPTYGRLEIEVTIDDPKAYTKPWTVRLDQTIVVDTELLDDNCMENEQSVKRMVGK